MSALQESGAGGAWSWESHAEGPSAGETTAGAGGGGSSDRSNHLEEKSISPSVFLQCPLVTELNIRPADKAKILTGLQAIFTEQVVKRDFGVEGQYIVFIVLTSSSCSPSLGSLHYFVTFEITVIIPTKL